MERLRDAVAGLYWGAALGDSLGLRTLGMTGDEAEFHYGLCGLSGIVKDQARAGLTSHSLSPATGLALLTLDSLTRWAGVVDDGSVGWAMLALADPDGSAMVSDGELDGFVDDDDSPRQHKSRMLLAGLAGLGRVADAEIAEYGERLGIDLAAQTRWTRMIERAAEVDNPALVAMLAGLGMQGSGWDRMTARHLFHIVSALRRVGLEAEARMIAAEAVARA